MATPRMDITSFVGKLLEENDVDLLREGVRVLAQAVMETEVSSQIGAGPYERSFERVAYRNGYRTRRWDTRSGTIELKIPKVSAGAYFPSLLEPRRRAEKALHAVVVEAYVKGVSTRKVDDLVRALGIDGISRSEVSRICKSLDEEVTTFLARPIDGEHPYVWLDATFHKVRQAGRVTSVATVVAIGVNDQGQRTILGAATGQSEDHQFWTSFLRSLIKRGLKGVRLVISDAHEGLRQAIAKILAGATWQRCRVHFMRNLLSTVPKGAQDTVAAVVRSIFTVKALTRASFSPLQGEGGGFETLSAHQDGLWCSTVGLHGGAASHRLMGLPNAAAGSSRGQAVGTFASCKGSEPPRPLSGRSGRCAGDGSLGCRTGLPRLGQTPMVGAARLHRRP
jgi:putative transposase